MEKLKMHSPDLTQDNIAKIRELFPGCVTEAAGMDGKIKLAIDFDQLRQELSDSIVDGPQERYRLDWPGKREALIAANSPIAKTLRPFISESVNFYETDNLLIEGDNLEALKLLQETYLEKVKLIYIDPPYNTGSDLVYDDDFSVGASGYLVHSNQKDASGHSLTSNPTSHGRFHSRWLSMMLPRLKVARNLLQDNGIICVSIDENEVDNLKLLMSEVFGRSNCLGVIANINNPKGRSDDKFIATAHEYLVVFAKDIARAEVFGFEPDDIVVKRYNKVLADGRVYRDMDLRKTGDADKRADRPDMFYYFYYDQAAGTLEVDRSQRLHTDAIEITPKKDDGTDGRWRWGFETAKSRIEDVYAKFMPTRNMWGIMEIDLLDGRPPVKSTSAWTFKDVNTERGSEEFISLGFTKDTFSRPKPVGTMRRILEFVTKPGERCTILDFFAGSGVFGQAALELNAELKRDLKFILVQIDEPTSSDSEAAKAGYSNIAEITKERVRRAGKKILSGNFDPKWDKDIGFRVLKIDTSNMADVYYTPDTTNQADLLANVESIKQGRTAEDLLFQVLVDWGVDLTLPIRRETVQGKTVFFVDENALVACFDTGVTEDLVKELAAHEPVRAVFRDTGFVSDAVKINVEQIFRQLSPGTEVKAI